MNEEKMGQIEFYFEFKNKFENDTLNWFSSKLKINKKDVDSNRWNFTLSL